MAFGCAAILAGRDALESLESAGKVCGVSEAYGLSNVDYGHVCLAQELHSFTDTAIH